MLRYFIKVGHGIIGHWRRQWCVLRVAEGLVRSIVVEYVIV